MSCELTAEISALVDGEAVPDRVRDLERHLAQCHECQEAHSQFLDLRSEITAIDPVIDPASSGQRLAQILGRSEPQPRSPWAGLIRPLRPATALAALALLAIVVAGLVLFRKEPSMSGPSSRTIARNDSGTKADVGNSDRTIALTNPSHDKGSGKTAPKRTKKSTRRVETPKRQTIPPELTSPYGSQVIAANEATTNDQLPQPADTESLTARHFEQTELLLRSFRNVRAQNADSRVEVAYERRRAQKLVYQNILLRREADAAGDVQVSTLLDSVEPILLDIANLPDQPHDDDVRAIKQRVEKKNLVALLQVNSVAFSRTND